MNLNSPRKVPLATGDEDRPSLMPRSAPALTNRVFFCGVVVENPGLGRQLPQGPFAFSSSTIDNTIQLETTRFCLHSEVQDLVASLGDPVELDQDESAAQSASDSTTDPSNPVRSSFNSISSLISN